MKVLADTSALIEFMRGNERAKSFITGAEKVYVSSLSLYEILVGRTPREEILGLVSSLDGVLPLTGRDGVIASSIYRKLKSEGKLIGSIDILIASQALTRKLTVLTKNKDFQIVKDVRVVLI